MPKNFLMVMNGLGLALLLGLMGCVRAAEQAPAYRVGALKAGDRVLVTAAGRDVVIDIYSEMGIGSAEIEPTAGAAPASLTLRFHLKGLEELRFAYAHTQVTVHVSSLGDGDVREEVWSSGGTTQSIDPDSPYWMAVRLPDGERIPLTSGAIEVTTSRAFLDSDDRSFSLRWIDFYR